MLQALQRPFQFVQRPLPLVDALEIHWWRLVFRTMRLLNRGKQTGMPLVLPVRQFLWVPAVALLCGIVLGWAIAAG